jgi:hypothetical protein
MWIRIITRCGEVRLKFISFKLHCGLVVNNFAECRCFEIFLLDHLVKSASVIPLQPRREAEQRELST